MALIAILHSVYKRINAYLFNRSFEDDWIAYYYLIRTDVEDAEKSVVVVDCKIRDECKLIQTGEILVVIGFEATKSLLLSDVKLTYQTLLFRNDPQLDHQVQLPILTYEERIKIAREFKLEKIKELDILAQQQKQPKIVPHCMLRILIANWLATKPNFLFEGYYDPRIFLWISAFL